MDMFPSPIKIGGYEHITTTWELNCTHNLDGCVLTLQHTTKHASQNLNEKLELERSYYKTSF